MPHFAKAKAAKAVVPEETDVDETEVESDVESEVESESDFEIPRVPSNETPKQKKVRVARELRNLRAKLNKSHGYQSYRAKALRDAREGVENGTWPERVHQSFLEGTVIWPAGPSGGSRGDGRNKEIATHILNMTGVGRDRKQISSHKQVIAGFFSASDELMSYYMGKKPQTQPRRPNRRHVGARNQRSRRGESATPSSSSVPRPGPLLSERLANIKADINVFKPTVFRMFIYKGEADEEPGEGAQILHTYTSTQNTSHHFNDSFRCFDTVIEKDPLLAELHVQNALVCNVLTGQITLAFPVHDIINNRNIKLATKFFCSSHHLPVGTELLCYNKIYQNTTLIDSTGPETITLYQPAGEEHPATGLKFSQVFWARKLQDIARRIRQAPLTKDPYAHMQGIKNDLLSLVMIQEINIMTTAGEERLMVVRWRFSLSTHAIGRAVWRRVTVRDEMNVNTRMIEPLLYDRNVTTAPVVAGPSRSSTMQSQTSHSSMPSTLAHSVVEDLKYDVAPVPVPSTMSEALLDMSLAATAGSMYCATSAAEDFAAIDPTLGVFAHHWEPPHDPYSMSSFLPQQTPQLSQQQIPYPILSRQQPQLAPSPAIVHNGLHHRQHSQTQQVPQQPARYYFEANTEHH